MTMEREDVAGSRMREINRLRGVVRRQDYELDRGNEILFQVLEHARKEAGKSFADQKDADDWLFSKFDITKEELEEIYEGKGVIPEVSNADEQNESMNAQSM